MKLDKPKIYSYTYGSMVVVWCNFTYKQYWFFDYKEAIATFKKEFGYKGKVNRVNYCPLILN